MNTCRMVHVSAGALRDRVLLRLGRAIQGVRGELLAREQRHHQAHDELDQDGPRREVHTVLHPPLRGPLVVRQLPASLGDSSSSSVRRLGPSNAPLQVNPFI